MRPTLKTAVWLAMLVIIALLASCGGDDGGNVVAGDQDPSDDDDDDTVILDDDDATDDDATDDDSGDDDDDDSVIAEPSRSLIAGVPGGNGIDAVVHEGNVVLAATKGRELAVYVHTGAGEWQETFVTDDAARPALAIGADDRVHLVYQQVTDRTVHYATNVDDVWQFTLLEGTEGSGDSSDIVLTSGGVIHTVYYSPARAGIYHVLYDGHAWQASTVAASTAFGGDVSLAVDFGDHLHLSFYDSTDGTLKYGFFDGVQWTQTMVDDSGVVGADNELAIDDAGNVFISYRAYVDDSLKVARRIDGVWSNETVDARAGAGFDTTIAATGPNDILVVHTYSPSEFECRPLASTWDGSAWTTAPFADSAEFAGNNALVATDDGYGVAFFAEPLFGTGEFNFAENNGAGWSVEAIERFGGRDPSVAAGPSSTVDVTYYDAADGDLILAARGLDNWALAAVAADGDTGHRSDLAIDGDVLHVCFHREPGGGLYYGATVGDSWNVTKIAELGRDCGIAVDADGVVWVSSVDDTEPALNLANNAGGTWQSEFVANASMFGGDTDIALSPDGSIHLSYFYGDGTFDVFHVDNITGGWFFHPVAQVTDAGTETSLVVDSGGHPHLFYTAGYDWQPSSLIHSTRDNAMTWSHEEIDADAGMWNSAVIDVDDKLHVAYFHHTEGDLVYGTNADGDWRLTPIDTGGEVGVYSALAYSEERNGLFLAYTAEYALYYAQFPVGYSEW